MSGGGTAIRAASLSKRYAIGRRARATLREQLMDLLRRGGGPPTEEFWALRDLDFEIPRGDAVGVIGRNGAGKSTLLKLLSRITHPTAGRMEIRGRVASLLEVGTGFHAELTGRENILLNGTILGMTRQEVRDRTDAIVAFSGVERFLDTPVKHYSSGMYVRLAFSVAAHLEPEILLVDEVLAVGDAEFQAKCLGKMGEVADEGRTVVLVSHDMGALRRLCRSGLVLDQGRLVARGPIEACVDAYAGVKQALVGADLAERTDRTGTGEVRFVGLELRSGGQSRARFLSGEPLEIAFDLERRPGPPNRDVLVWFQVMRDEQVLFTGNSALYGRLELDGERHRATCTIPRLPLFGGRYELRIFVMVDGRRADYVEHAAAFDVDEGHFFPTGKTPTEKVGVLVEQRWRLDGR